MGQDAKVCLNLGCGFNKKPGFINVDKFDNCEPDVQWDLDEIPFPWEDNSVDLIEIFHTLEHVQNWYPCLTEMARILKVGGSLEIRVPDESDPNALAYRDHYHVFTRRSFDNVVSGVPRSTTNAEFLQMNTVPLWDIGYAQVPYERYQWMEDTEDPCDPQVQVGMERGVDFNVEDNNVVHTVSRIWISAILII